MIILDTDHFNILQVGKGPPYDTLAAHMDASPDQHFVTTVITFEEHMRGWLAGIRRARDIVNQIRPYDQLINLVRFVQAWEILRFDERAAERFRELRQQRVLCPRGSPQAEFPPLAPAQGPSAKGRIALALRAARVEQGLTLEQLARQAGFADAEIVRAIEYGSDAKLSDITAIAAALGLSVELVSDTSS